MSKVLTPDSVEEYERLLEAAAAQQVPVQAYGNYTLIVPEQWRPPRAPKAAKAEPEPPKTEPAPEPAPEPKAALKAEPKQPSETSKSAHSSSKEVG